PVIGRRRIDPHRARPGENRALEPDPPRLRIEMLDRASGGGDFVWAHRGVANEDHAVVPAVRVDEVARRHALVMAAAVVLPHALVEAVVEVEMLEPLELALGGGEELLGRLNVPIHRAADVEKQQHLDRVAPLGPEQNVDIAFIGARTDRAVEVELFGRALSCKAAEAPKRELDVARTELRVAVEVFELTPVPDL